MFRFNRSKQSMSGTSTTVTRTTTAGTIIITSTNTSIDNSSRVKEDVLISYPPPSPSAAIGSMTDNNNVYRANSMTSSSNSINNGNNNSVNSIAHQSLRRASVTSSSSTTTTSSLGVGSFSRGITHITSSTTGAGHFTGSMVVNRSKKGLEKSLQQLLLSNKCYYNNDMKNSTLIKQHLIPLLLHTTFGSSLYPAIVIGRSFGYAPVQNVSTTQWIDYFNIDYNNDNHIVLTKNITFPNECCWNILEQNQQRNSNLYKECKDNTCLVLSGIIPYFYKNKTYSQYIDIYLPYPSFPNDPPIVFVRKRDNPTITTGTTETVAPSFSTSSRSNTSTTGSTNSIVEDDLMKNRTGATTSTGTSSSSHTSITKEIFSDMNKQIDRKTGEVYSNYLSDWDATATTSSRTGSCSDTGSTLIGLLQQLSNDFSIQPPMRAVPVAVEENETVLDAVKRCENNTNIYPPTTTRTSIVDPSPPPPSLQTPAVVANKQQQQQQQQHQQNLINDSMYTNSIYEVPDSNQKQQRQPQELRVSAELAQMKSQKQFIDISQKETSSLFVAASAVTQKETEQTHIVVEQKQQHPTHNDMTGIIPIVSPIQPPITATSSLPPRIIDINNNTTTAGISSNSATGSIINPLIQQQSRLRNQSRSSSKKNKCRRKSSKVDIATLINQGMLRSGGCFYNDRKNMIKQIKDLTDQDDLQLEPAIVTYNSKQQLTASTTSVTSATNISTNTSTTWLLSSNNERNVTFPNECLWDQEDLSLSSRCHNNKCIVLSGKIPYRYNNVDKMQYIDMYLPHPEFPSEPPVVYVRKSNSARQYEQCFVQNHTNVSAKDGKVFSNYITDWNKETSTLLELIRRLSSAFSHIPPTILQPVRQEHEQEQEHQSVAGQPIIIPSQDEDVSQLSDNVSETQLDWGIEQHLQDEDAKSDEYQQFQPTTVQLPITLSMGGIDKHLEKGGMIISIDQSCQKQEELRRNAGRKEWIQQKMSRTHDKNDDVSNAATNIGDNECTQRASNCRNSNNNLLLMNNNEQTQKISNVNNNYTINKHHRNTSSLTDLFKLDMTVQPSVIPIMKMQSQQTPTQLPDESTNLTVDINKTNGQDIQSDIGDISTKLDNDYWIGNYNTVQNSCVDTMHLNNETTDTDATKSVQPNVYMIEDSRLKSYNNAAATETIGSVSDVNVDERTGDLATVSNTNDGNTMTTTPITKKEILNPGASPSSTSTNTSNASASKGSDFRIFGINTAAALAKKELAARMYNIESKALVQVPNNGLHQRTSSVDITGSHTMHHSQGARSTKNLHPKVNRIDNNNSGACQTSQDSLRVVTLKPFPACVQQQQPPQHQKIPSYSQEPIIPFMPQQMKSTTSQCNTVESSISDFYNNIRLKLQLQQSEQFVEKQLTLYRAYKQKLVQQLHHVQMSTKVVDETLIKIHAQQQSYRAITFQQQQQQQRLAMTNGRTTGDNNVNIHPRSQSFSHSDYTFSCADMLQRNLLEIVNNNNARQDNVRSRQSSMTEQTDNSDTTLITLKVDVVDEQVILLEAEDSAYQDLIRKINYAFDNDFVSSENYFKLLRKVAKQHFYVRAYKISMIRKRRISC